MKRLYAVLALVAVLNLFVATPVLATTNTASASFVRTSAQYASLANKLSVSGGIITIEGWMFLNSAPAISGDQRGIFSQQESTTETQYTLSYENQGGVLGMYAVRSRAGVADNKAIWNTTLSLNTWYHMVLVYDNTNVTLYMAQVAGTHVQEAQTASSGNGSGFTVPDCSSMGMILNTRNSGDSCATSVTNATAQLSDMDGLVDDVRVWNTARTTAQMDANFQCELTGSETGLVAYYKVNTNFNDSTANAFNLTATNAPTFSATVPFTTCATGATFNPWQFFGL